jgi:hypothetical protein
MARRGAAHALFSRFCGTGQVVGRSLLIRYFTNLPTDNLMLAE